MLEQRRPPAREGRVREVAQRRDRAAAVEGRRFREAQDAVDDAVGPRGGERRLLEGLRFVEGVALRRPGRPRGRELRRPREAARRDPAAALDGRALRRRGLERGADPPEPRVRRRRGAELVGRAAPGRRDGRHGLDDGAARELEGRPRREDGHVLGREVARVGDGRPVVGRPLAQGRGRDDAAAAHREAAAPRGRRGRGRPAPALAVLEVAAGLRRRLEERVARREDARVRAVADADGRPRDGQRQAPERGLADLRGAVKSRNTHTRRRRGASPRAANCLRRCRRLPRCEIGSEGFANPRTPTHRLRDAGHLAPAAAAAGHLLVAAHLRRRRGGARAGRVSMDLGDAAGQAGLARRRRVVVAVHRQLLAGHGVHDRRRRGGDRRLGRGQPLHRIFTPGCLQQKTLASSRST